MNKHTTRFDWLEGRRQRAWELKQQGWKQQDSAAALGVTPEAIGARVLDDQRVRHALCWSVFDG